jgi:DNA-binding response OmpR family regulator
MYPVLTGKEDRIKAMNAGLNYFMSKPAEKRELNTTNERTLNGKSKDTGN